MKKSFLAMGVRLILLLLSLQFMLSVAPAFGERHRPNFYSTLRIQQRDTVSNPDEQFRMAQQLAVKQKKYEEARVLLEKLLKDYPNYHDAKLLMAQTFAWQKKYEEAFGVLQPFMSQLADSLGIRHRNWTSDSSTEVLQVKESNPNWYYWLEGLKLKTSMYWWTSNADSLRAYARIGASLQPGNAYWFLMQARAAEWKGQYREAAAQLARALQQDPKNEEARLMFQRLQSAVAPNLIDLTYDLVAFTDQFPQPWHNLSLGYMRQTKWAPVGARVSRAKRFNRDGWQFSAEAYPRFSSNWYGYAQIGYSGDLPVFPEIQSAFSLYRALRGGWELEGGWRLLKFEEARNLYVAGLSKYAGSWWLQARSFVGWIDGRPDQSYFLQARYYTGTERYWSLLVGRGITPDESGRNAILNRDFNFTSSRVLMGYRAYWGPQLVHFQAGAARDNFAPGRAGWQYQLSIQLGRRF